MLSLEGRDISYMVVDGNGLPQDRAAKEAAQEWIQWLHPRDDDRLANDKAPNICAGNLFCRVQSNHSRPDRVVLGASDRHEI